MGQMCKKVAKSLVVSEKSTIFAPSRDNFPLASELMKTRTDSRQQLEVIGFSKGWEQATVVTDGAQTRSFTAKECQAHGSIKKAIAHLEAQGYHIIPDAAW